MCFSFSVSSDLAFAKSIVTISSVDNVLLKRLRMPATVSCTDG